MILKLCDKELTEQETDMEISMSDGFIALSSVTAQEKILKAAGATHVFYGTWELKGELVGYRDEWDRDEDRIYYDYFVRKDLT